MFTFTCLVNMGGPQDSGARNVLILLRIEGVGCSQNKF